MLHNWTFVPATPQMPEIAVPMAEIELRLPDGNFVGLHLVVDTGLPYCILRASTAQRLQIEGPPARQITFKSPTGQDTTATLHITTAKISGFGPMELPVAVVEQEGAIESLGSLGLLDRFQVDLDPSTQETQIRPPWMNATDRRIWEFYVQTERHILDRVDDVGWSPTALSVIKDFLSRGQQYLADLLGLAKLHRGYTAPVLIRGMLDLAAQFEYLMQDPEKRSLQYREFLVVSKLKALEHMVRVQGPIAQHVMSSTNRPAEEARLRAEFNRVEQQFRIDKKRMWDNWFCMTARDLMKVIGWEDEWRMWFVGFSGWVHSDPFSMVMPKHNPAILSQFAYHYYSCMLTAASRNILLTHEQYGVLTRFANPFL